MKSANQGNNYSYVLAFLILILCSVPFRDLGWVGMDFILSVLHTAFIISAVYSCRHKPKLRIIIGLLATLSIVSTWESSIFANTHESVRLISSIVFYVIFTYIILEDILKTRRADQNMLSGSLSAYMLFGMTFAFIYALLEIQIPGSFVIPEGTVAITEANKHEILLGYFFYHSFVTLTTLGYGDIQPISQPARFFCIIEAIIGQFYLVVIVAGIVGSTASKYFSESPKE